MSNDYFSSYSALPRNQLARAEAVNAIADAIIVGFDQLPDVAPLTEDRVTFCTDTGAANAYVIAPTHAIIAYNAGAYFSFVATHENTGASTLNVSGLGVKTIKRFDGTDLGAGEILNGQVIEVRYDGTFFQLTSTNSADAASAAASATSATASASAASTSQTAAAASATSASSSATQAAASATTAGATVAQWAVAGGTADALTAAYPTTVNALADGLILAFRGASANATTTPTFKADGTTAHTITKTGGTALVAGDIVQYGEYLVRYNLANTRWEITAGAAATPATRQVLLSGTAATYTTPAGVRQLRVRMKAGGAGGNGSGAGAGAGGTGGTTTFNSINAAGGTAATPSGAPGGGAGGSGGSGTASFRLAGAAGQVPGLLIWTATDFVISGATGGGSGGGSSPVPVAGGTAGVAGLVNTGGGGSGASTAEGSQTTLAAYDVGAGGGEGEYVELIINSPSATYTYTVGAGGSVGLTGTSGKAGGAGGSGYIIVEEFY